MTKIDAILQTMRFEGLETSTEIADHLGFFRGTVSALLDKLERRKWVRKNGKFFPQTDMPAKPLNRWKLTDAGLAATA